MQELEDRRDQHRREMMRDRKAWEAGEEARAEEHRREVAAHWRALAVRADARAELELHAERMARLHRILDVAVDSDDHELMAHTRRVIQREIARNARMMVRIQERGAR